MIRTYRESDVESVALVFTESIHELAKAHYDAVQLAAWAPRPPDIDTWMARLASLRTLVAETDTELDGFISYEPNGHIDLLYTSPKRSRRGIAAALYLEVETILASSGITELVTEASIVARPVFERWGFHVTEEQYVQRHGVTFQRYEMRKSLISQPPLAGDVFKATRA